MNTPLSQPSPPQGNHCAMLAVGSFERGIWILPRFGGFGGYFCPILSVFTRFFLILDGVRAWSGRKACDTSQVEGHSDHQDLACDPG